MFPRIGLGSDSHALIPGNGIMLGGVRVPCDLGVRAHSDGDALLHAVTDAILGALGAGDIGELFPDSDPVNRDRDSAAFLSEAIGRMREAGYALGNLDATVRLERPKLGTLKAAIRERLAELCDCPAERVSVKAKTGEGLGPVGRGEAVEAEAAVLLVPAWKDGREKA